MRAAKYLVKSLLSYIVLPVRNGPLKGKKWIVSSGSRFLKGTYEPLQTQVFVDHIKNGNTILDIGSHVGYFSILSSILAGDNGKVVCFEPLPLNLRYLKRHIALNHCNNVQVCECCIADQEGEVQFDNSHGTGTGHMASNGHLTVTVNSLDNLFTSEKIPAPDFIKIDVEGAEELVLQGAEKILCTIRPTFLISVHSDELLTNCIKILEEKRYSIRMIGNEDILALPA